MIDRDLERRICTPLIAVAAVPLIYGIYFLLQWSLSNTTIRLAGQTALFPDSQARERARLMLLSDGMDIWPPAFSGSAIRIILPAVLIVASLVLALRSRP